MALYTTTQNSQKGKVMKRLKPGELRDMSPEDRRAHIKELQKQWRDRNHEKLREQNHKWSLYYQKYRPFKCICHICGKEFGAPRNYFVTCSDCIRARIDHNKSLRAAIILRQEAKVKRNKEIIRLRKKGLLQSEIAAKVGIGQAGVSYVLRSHGYRTLEKRTRK